MKTYKLFSLLLILMLIFSLSLTGCSPETEKNDPENQEEETPSDKYDTENNEINADDNQENDEISNEELDESKDDETNTDKEQIKEYITSENTDESIESDDESNNLDGNAEEISEEDSESEDLSSDDKSNEEMSSGESEDISQENDSEETKQEQTNILKIEGSVTNNLFLSLDDLKTMEDLIYSGTFYSLNSFGTTEYTDFKGVKLWSLLNEKALISEEASTIKVIALDGYSIEFTIQEIKRDDYIDETNQDLKLPVIIAWEENGEEYNPEEGPPYKLVIGQKEPGDVNKPQWVRNIDKIIAE